MMPGLESIYEPLLFQQPRPCCLQHVEPTKPHSGRVRKTSIFIHCRIAKEHKIPLIAAGGMPNHSHLLFVLPPSMSLADAVNKFKTNSSRFVRRQGIDFNWQVGYGAFSVSASQIETVKAYIRNQREHHKNRSFEREFV